ncbi:hypothetical protein RRF57_009853 [Xylaria bambusicola]|uniref:Integrase catalytic domain-containing protein n=1 Tax=Xylaria bambusicola TaxID=326684 RepID=A0AAN7V009_9PEZI
MAQNTVDYIRSCMKCAQFNSAAPRALDLPVTISEPFQILVVDFVGPFVTPNRKFKYILCVVDVFSRYGWGFPSLSYTASTAFVFIKQWRDQMGTIPLTVYSDPRSVLFSREFRERMGELGIHTLNAPSKSHKSVSVVEISNRIVQSILNKIHDLTYPKDWDPYVSEALRAINARHVDHLGYSPFEIIHGHLLRDRLSKAYPSAPLRSLIAAILQGESILPTEYQHEQLALNHVAHL